MLSWLPAFFAMKNAASSSGSPAHVPRVVYPPEQGQFFGFYAFSGGSSIFLPFFFFFLTTSRYFYISFGGVCGLFHFPI